MTVVIVIPAKLIKGTLIIPYHHIKYSKTGDMPPGFLESG
jgi:hypothetical protein